MNHTSNNLTSHIPRCLLAIAVIALQPALCVGQDARAQELWIQTLRNQPSGEYAPDHRKTDPFQSMLSDADHDAIAAKTAPSFLTQFTSQVRTSAIEDTDEATAAILESLSDEPLSPDELIEYDTNPSSRSSRISHDSQGYTELEDIMPEMQAAPPMTAQQVFSSQPTPCNSCVGWQVLPKGLMYKSYIAGEKEPRMQFVQLYDTRSKTRVWDATLGGRVGILRNGTYDSVNPQGFQLDLEGAVFARVFPDQPSAMLNGSDYRGGLLGTQRLGGTAYKWGYYHVSSHIGDEYLIANPTFNRLNYVRDSLITGVTQDLPYYTQVYAEIAYALGAEGGAKPLEFQFGTQYLPVARSSLKGAPYFAANYHIREDFNFHGGFNTVAGWNWQGVETRHRLRLGMQYYNGPSMQYQFLDTWENMYGGGIWFDY